MTEQLNILFNRAKIARQYLKDCRDTLTTNIVDWVPNEQHSYHQSFSQLLTMLETEMALLSHTLDDNNTTTSIASLVTCSNIPFIEAMSACIGTQPGVLAINRKIATNDNDSPLQIDVIANWGTCWIKVIARQSLSASTPTSSPLSTLKEEALLKTLKRYLNAACLHPCQYQIPSIAVWSHYKLSNRLLARLNDFGILVLSQPSCEPMLLGNNPSSTLIRNLSQYPWSSTINLDTTTLIGLCSDMSHLSKDQLSLIKSTGVVELDRQIKMTRHEPDSLQELRYILLGYYYKPQEQQQHATSFRVVVAQSVWDKFYQIINMLGGIKEKLRAETIRYRFNEWLVCPSPGTSAIIPSLPHSCQLSIINTTTADHENTEAVLINPSAHSIVLSRRILTLNRRLTPLQKTVFGLGDALNATTITANERAIRKIEESLNDTGVIGTWLHSPRSLCGDKLEIL